MIRKSSFFPIDHSSANKRRNYNRARGAAWAFKLGSYRPGRTSIYPWISGIWTLCPGCCKAAWKQGAELVDSIIRLKENTRADALLYAPALATPENLSMLIYLGVDLVDETLPIIKGYQDIYLTNSGNSTSTGCMNYRAPVRVFFKKAAGIVKIA